ncbi:MAG: flagellar hook-basal body protein [Candidatus Hydrogenedentes bacterium]|nr:flagellar hook-basal body protein [Candidatus Hydrogenedentota bacterium]
MITGLYISAGGMVSTELRHSVYANNIANSATVAYKSQVPVQLGFYPLLRASAGKFKIAIPNSAPGGGVKVVETYPDWTLGPIRKTDNPLDLAIQGPGFLVVQTPKGERYTKAGNLTRDSEGYLSTSQGYRVLGDNNQPILVQGTNVNIATDGNVTVDGVNVGRIQCVGFAHPERLLREGENLYYASEDIVGEKTPSVDSKIMQGYLEWSNIKLPYEMIKMTLGLRSYEANQRVLVTFDESLGRLIDQVGLAG